MSKRRIGRFLAAGALVGALVPVGAAPAAATYGQVCGPWVQTGNFGDVNPTTAHAFDIDCIKFWDITTQTGTYDPKGTVTRWQMALFLTRTVNLTLYGAATGTDQGFIDISGLSDDARVAINTVRQLDVTTGKSPTLYDPYSAVTREQMALFLTRLVRAAGVTLPGGAGGPFADIAGLSAESRTAINQVRELGITSGTSATTYSPGQMVTREQMASFLARTLGIIWALDLIGDGGCDIPINADDPLVCSGNTFEVATTPLVIRSFWYLPKPALPEDVAGFNSSATSIAVTVDGHALALTPVSLELSGLSLRFWSALIPAGLVGDHVVETRYFYDGKLAATTTTYVTFG